MVRVALLLVVAGCDKLLGLSPVSPPTVVGPTTWTAVSAGFFHVCGIHGDGTLWCWGDNSFGQLGLGSVLEVDTPSEITTATWTQVSAGDDFTCAIQTDQSLWCWGRNQRGETGTGARGVQTGNPRTQFNYYVTSDPTRLDGSWSTIATGTEVACGIQVDGSLWCWGANDYGQVADPDTQVSRPSPSLVDRGPWTSVAVGEYHACALRGDGSVWCWGHGTEGELGVGATQNPFALTAPARIADVGVAKWKALAVGERTSCAISDDATHELYCWGILADNSTAYVPTAVSLAGGKFADLTDIAIGGNEISEYGFAPTFCARRSDRSLWCWGLNHRGQLGPLAAGMIQVKEPLPVMTGSTWQTASVGWTNVCAIDDDGALWCSGADARGQLGDGGTSHRVPTQVPGMWTGVAAGRAATCALDPTRHVYCAGSGKDGGMGDGTRNSKQSLSPVQLAATIQQVAVGDELACALDDGGLVWCWGNDYHGALGDNFSNQGFTTLPAQTIATKFTAVATSAHTCALDTAGGVWCWGNDSWGQIGNNSTNDVPLPFQVMLMGTAQQIVLGYQHTCALASDGTTYCWGAAGEGECGIGVVPAGSWCPMPTTVPTLAFATLASGDFHTCGLGAQGQAGELWCWGYGDHGQLGLAGFGNALSPARVGTATWLAVAGGSLHTCGIQSDHTLWCWGENAYGQLGDGTLEARAAPIRVGDANARWNELHLGANHTCATREDGSLWCWGLNEDGQLGDGTAWTQDFTLVR